MHTHAKTKNNNGNKKQTKQNNNNNINDNISKFSCKCFFFPFFQTDVPVYFVHFSSFMAKLADLLTQDYLPGFRNFIPLICPAG